MFPNFNSPKNYVPYLNQSFDRWTATLWKLLILLYFLEAAYVMEYAFLPYPDWIPRILSRIYLWVFYLLAVGGRALIFKRCYRHRIRYANISDFVFFCLLVGVLVAIDLTPQGATIQIIVFNQSVILRFFASFLILSLTFFNWIYQPLVITAGLGSTIALDQKTTSGYEMLYIPSYVAITIVFAIFSYSYEKSKRKNFEFETAALSKEKVWKDILKELPEGIIVTSQQGAVIYHNPATLYLLGLGNNLDLSDIATINQHINLIIYEYANITDIRSTSFPQTPLTFSDIQAKIWNSWTSRKRSPVVQGQSSGTNYLSFKGLLRKQNGEASMEIKCAVKDFAGQSVALYIFHNISERQKMESLQQTLQYKERLLASVSHELLTPLNASLNFIEQAIQSKRLDDNLKNNFLVPALRASRYLLTIIHDIVDFSQIQSRKIRLNPVLRSVVRSAEDALELVELQAKRKNLKLELKLPSSGWDECLKLDHIRLIQVLNNLLSNALKFTFTGSIILKITQISKTILKFEVEDTGIGISLEDQKYLFKPSQKVGSQDNKFLNPQGVGLGLEIANELAKTLRPQALLPEIEQFDEDVALYVKSKPKEGSLFWFYVEGTEGQDDWSVAEEEKNNESQSRLANVEIVEEMTEKQFSIYEENSTPKGTMRQNPVSPVENVCDCPNILISDDDTFNLLALENVLTSLGQTVQSTYNGKEALEAVHRRAEKKCSPSCKPFSLILLDCNMPIMDGYECATEIKRFWSKNPSEKGIIIACTAAVQASERQKALNAGMDEFIEKPISKTKIREMLNKYIQLTQERLT